MAPGTEGSRDPLPGEEWAYRLREDAPSEKVHIVTVHRKGRKIRVDIRHLEGQPPGREENVPRSRLKVSWQNVDRYDASMEAWRRLRAESIDEHESSALWAALELVIPSEVAELSAVSSDDVLTVHDHQALETLTGQAVSGFQTEFSWLVHDGEVFLSPRAAISVAERACRRNPGPVLDLVMAEEAVAREKSKRGGTTKNWETREETTTSPEYEYDHYLRWQKPVHEILRQWCGYRAVTAHERLLAAEAEVKRLDILLAEAVDLLRRTDERAAEMIEREHEEERITAYAIRPVPQRPLKPHEIPRIEVPTRRGWYR
ncbi:hypothetical protein [Pseudarthrobacter sp. NPDC080039]|uniref:hypothetical protein n=1 Tax=unclassified Pseudarthrobacter TaxID=2647000 RepID=UPI003450BFC4